MQWLRLAELILAIAMATGAMASLCGRLSRTLDVAAHFAPIWLGGSLLALGLAAALGEAQVALLAGLAAAASVALIGPELVVRQARKNLADRPTLKVVQFNLWRLNADVPGTVAWLRAQEADIVVLQEVVGAAAAVPRALAGAYPHHQGDTDTGTWILSRTKPVRGGTYRAASTRTHNTGAWAHFEHPLGAFAVMGFQATWPIPPGKQQADAEALALFLRRFEAESLIVCGDFNATPWSASLRRQDRLFGLQRLTRACFTWPVRPFFRLRLQSPVPFLALDHVYAGAGWRAIDVRVGPRLGSDHLPVIAMLALRDT